MQPTSRFRSLVSNFSLLLRTVRLKEVLLCVLRLQTLRRTTWMVLTTIKKEKMCPSTLPTAGMKHMATSTKRTFVSAKRSFNPAIAIVSNKKTCVLLTGLRSTPLTRFSKMIGKPTRTDQLGLLALALNLWSGRFFQWLKAIWIIVLILLSKWLTSTIGPGLTPAGSQKQTSQL